MISIECYTGLPLEYESFLVKKYDSYLTTCRYIEIYYNTYDIHYMVVYEDGNLTELLIFGNKGHISTCLNSFVDIKQNIISECIKNIFKIYPTINKIVIALSYIRFSLKKSILISKSNDHILELPYSIDNYFSELGRNTRQHIKNYKVRLLRDHPDVKFITKYKNDIDEQTIERIIQLNIDRMKYKGIVSGKDISDKNNIFKYALHYGCVSYMEKDGVILAGSISYILDKRIFLYVIAHDCNFSIYNIGQICIVYLIQASIEKKLSTFHFLSGDNEYKRRFLGNPYSLFSNIIYRTYTIDYFFNKNKAFFLRTLIMFRLSKYSKPIRDTIKFYRRKKWNT